MNIFRNGILFLEDVVALKRAFYGLVWKYSSWPTMANVRYPRQIRIQWPYKGSYTEGHNFPPCDDDIICLHKLLLPQQITLVPPSTSSIQHVPELSVVSMSNWHVAVAWLLTIAKPFLSVCCHTGLAETMGTFVGTRIAGNKETASAVVNFVSVVSFTRACSKWYAQSIHHIDCAVWLFFDGATSSTWADTQLASHGHWKCLQWHAAALSTRQFQFTHAEAKLEMKHKDFPELWLPEKTIHTYFHYHSRKGQRSFARRLIKTANVFITFFCNFVIKLTKWVTFFEI